MNDFYTNVQIQGGKILYRGIEDGRRVNKRVGYSPTLFIASNKPSKFKTLQNEFVEPIELDSISSAREFVNQYEGVQNFKIYGNRRYEYSFISDKFTSAIEWNKDHILVCNIDIEVASENGFPTPSAASEIITAITYKIGKKFMVFGCGVFKNVRTDVQYIHCQDELDLIQKFMNEWTSDYPDIITGWNVKFFDVPYLINRMINLFGENFAKRFSPWNKFSERTVFVMGRDQTTKTPLGIAVLDYMELYRKYAPQGNSRESYKLDAICAVEINERKLSYEEYGTLHLLYKHDYQKFIEYNIRDVELVERLDNKLKLIELALNLAYDSKTNYEDVFTQVRMWDALTYNRLKSMNIVVPPNEKGSKPDSYIGGYVKEPQIGLHKWVVSFDLDSLYPHLIMQFSISPDSFVPQENIKNRINLLKKSLNTPK